AYHRAYVIHVGPVFPFVGRHSHSRIFVLVHEPEIEETAVVNRHRRITTAAGSPGNRPHFPCGSVVFGESEAVFFRVDWSNARGVRDIDRAVRTDFHMAVKTFTLAQRSGIRRYE